MTVQYPSFGVPSESGPKNPLKGISVKLLVLASYAQWGVSAGRTPRSLNCEGCGVRANRNGIRRTTRCPWRPLSCDADHTEDALRSED